MENTLAGVVRKHSAPLSILAAGFFITVAIGYVPPPSGATAVDVKALQETVLPSDGVTPPITWNDLGERMVAIGVIDEQKLEALYNDRGGFPAEYRKLIEKNADGKIVITNWNAGYLLNLFWALGLANKNPILADAHEMMDPAYGGAGNFASTGGWTLAKGNPMDYYDRYELIPLTKEQQALVDRVSRNIFRPCCGNSTHFPDCNHGMAMLALLELMASQGVNEQDMYKTALLVNSFWFPQTYLTIAEFEAQKGVAWKDVSPKEMLGAEYSSAAGYANIVSQVARPQQGRRGGECSA